MKQQSGLSLIELLLSLSLAAVIMLGVSAVANTSVTAGRYSAGRIALDTELQQALLRMRESVARTRKLMIPSPDNPATAQDESLRSVLAVTLDPLLDRDLDGWSDANNDTDFEDLDGDTAQDDGEPQRIDEDTGNDMNADGSSGIAGIDDDGDGSIDEDNKKDDDEDGSNDEDYLNTDTDDDLAVGEDLGKKAVDGGDEDDDGDGATDEVWIDVVVFYVDSDRNLRQHLPAIDAGSGIDSSADMILLSRVSELSVQRHYRRGGLRPWVTISLTVVDEEGNSLSRSLQAFEGSEL